MLRLALIGYGYWGPNYGRIIGELPGCELVGCADISPAALGRARERLPDVDMTTDYHEWLSRDDIDAAIIATPTATHLPVVRDWLSAGKHVLCEKPLTYSEAEALKLADLAESCKRVLMVGHTFLFNPGVLKLKEYLDQGVLGKPLYVYSHRMGLGPVRKDANALWDLAPHDVSIILYLFGQDIHVEEVVARGECYVQPDVEDVVFMTVRMQDRIAANIHVAWLDPAKVRRLTIVGTEKMAVFDDVDPFNRVSLYDKKIRYAPSEASFGEFQAILHDGDILIPKVPAREPLKDQVAHFLQCVRGEAECFSDAKFASAVIGVLEQAQKSLDDVRARQPSHQ